MSVTGKSAGASVTFSAVLAFSPMMFPPPLMLAIRLSTSAVSLCPVASMMGGRSLTIFTTLATMVGEPLIPTLVVSTFTSSALKTVTVELRALMAPISEGLRGGMPVGAMEMVQGIGSFII